MNLDKNYIIEFLTRNKKYLASEYGVTSISLFGSFARGEENQESDVDLLVEMDEPTFSKLAGLEIYLENAFGRKVTAVRKHMNLKPRFLKIISKDLISVS